MLSFQPAAHVGDERRGVNFGGTRPNALAHPETGELVPACVQHSVLDPGENQELRRSFPLSVVRSGPAE